MDRLFMRIRVGNLARRSYILLAVLLLYAGQGSAQSVYSTLTEKVTYAGEKVNAVALLQSLQKQTSYTFTFDNSSLKAYYFYSINFRSVPLGNVLRYLNRYAGLNFSLADKNISVQLGNVHQPGNVHGQVLDAVTGDPVIGATIKVDDTGAVTDVKGEYSIELPVGVYQLLVSSVGYTSRKYTDIHVQTGSPFILNIALSAQRGTLKGVEVVANAHRESVAALYLKQKNNAAISDGISAEQIKVTPDNNAAQVLKRVSGLTIQDDKFVTVRGLSDRYNNVMLNGSTLPSTEPNRRNFSFDIIPSGLIDNIIVNKTARPDMPAEFAGGLVQVTTKDIPDANYGSIMLGSGYNTNSAGRRMYSTKRGDYDYLGFDDGKRGWWRKLWDRFTYADYLRNSDYKSAAAMNQHIPNNWGLRSYAYFPVQNFQANAGRRITFRNGAKLGITLGLTYRHEEHIADEERRTYLGDQYDFSGAAYSFNSAWGGILNVAYLQKGHRITFNNLYTRLFSNDTYDYSGNIRGFGPEFGHTYTNATLINSIWQRRLEGTHAIGKSGIIAGWHADWISVIRDQPDSRNSLGFHDPGDPNGFSRYIIADKTGFLGRGLSLFNSRLEETRYNWGADVTIPFLPKNGRQKLKIGYAGAYRAADFISNGLLAVLDPSAGSNQEFVKLASLLPDYELLSGKYLRPGGIYYFPTGTNNVAGGNVGDAYNGLQQLNAAYLMLDLNLLKKVRLTGGVRMEHNRTTVNTVSFTPQTGKAVDSLILYKKTDFLPSANLIYSVTPKVNIRLAYSETLSRPDFRERSPFIYYEFKERTEYKGAYGLKDARIYNFDLRFEFYPASGEVLSASVFYKKFDSPVELVVGGVPGGAQVYYYFNLRNSVNTGVEVDVRKTLGFLDPSSVWLSNFVLSGNASWMKANVRYNTQEMLDAANGVSGGQWKELPPDSRKRPLQGLSPYVYNAGIGYTGKPVGVQVSYNRYGPRIVAGGLLPYMDQYENARDVLDLQVSTRLLENKLDIRLNVSDLLQQPFIIYDNVKLLNNVSFIGDGTDARDNVNNDPRGTRYNPGLDYTRYRSYRGTNITLNATYNF
ncbi:MAG TPA: TonB-dependent receptor [Chitinophaga sp.]|uniref:TonB-dependent receptor n=1 Tax=Chitinophaga sp. TaxID=1869181 RepID=UPI002BB4EE92|nr:TonB-dependent receptor [Chitinophaga sp.]HVI43508.1 TonB-dependent receptor [Chitinophaga sp.]